MKDKKENREYGKALEKESGLQILTSTRGNTLTIMLTARHASDDTGHPIKLFSAF